MQYPLNIRFKLLALTQQISVTDATGAQVFYVKQKMFKLKENIEIYRDSNKSELLFTIKADKVIDFSPTYTVYDKAGNAKGSITREGARSLWKASYTLQLPEGVTAKVREANPWTKVMDSFFGELPIIGLFAGLVFHPKYVVKDSGDAEIASIEKKPAVFEGVYELNGQAMASWNDESQYFASVLLMMVVIMERSRG